LQNNFKQRYTMQKFLEQRLNTTTGKIRNYEYSNPNELLLLASRELTNKDNATYNIDTFVYYDCNNVEILDLNELIQFLTNPNDDIGCFYYWIDSTMITLTKENAILNDSETLVTLCNLQLIQND